jgi:hypothetical protein
MPGAERRLQVNTGSKLAVGVALTAFLVISLAGAVSAAQKSLVSTIDVKLERGELTVDQYALDLADAIVRPEQSISKHAAAHVSSAPCGTPIADRIASVWDRLSLDTQQTVLAKMKARPWGDGEGYTVDTTHFRIHYMNPAYEGYCESLASIFEYCWSIEIDSLGYEPPPDDNGRGGDNRYDVYVTALSGGTLGLCAPESFFSPAPSYIQIDNQLDLDTRKTTSSHEFFHAIQNYYDVQSPTWWKENTAVAVEDRVYDGINQYISFYLGSTDYFFPRPELSISYTGDDEDLHEYAGCVWPLSLWNQFDIDIWKLIFEYDQSYGIWNAIDLACQDYGSSVDEAFARFTRWNYNTDCRYLPSDSYEEGAMFGNSRIDRVHSSYPTGTKTPTINLENRSSAYVEFELNGAPGDFTIDFNGDNGYDWHVSIITMSADGVYDTSGEIPLDGFGDGSIVISNSEQYVRVIMVPVVLSASGTGISYTYSADAPAAQEPIVFLWDDDDGDTPFDGSGDEYTKCEGEEFPVKEALLANGLSVVVGEALPTNLSPYSAVFYVGGVTGDMADVEMTDAEATRLTSFMDSGGDVYVEEPLFGTWYYLLGSAADTAMWNRFRCDYVQGNQSNTGNVLTLNGVDSSFVTTSMTFDYDYKDFPDHYVGRVTPKAGSGAIQLWTDQTGFGRGVAYSDQSTGSQRVMSPVMIGGMTDGVSPSTRAEYMENILGYFGLLYPGIETDIAVGISDVTLSQNSPNPFNPLTRISFVVPDDGAVTRLDVFDISGRLVKTLVYGEGISGRLETTWDGTDSYGNRVSSGTYFYRLSVDDMTVTRKMILLK